MAQLMHAFDARRFDPTQGTGSLPVGRHLVIVESSEVKANKANDGGYLQLNLKIVEGPQQGVSGAYRLNLYHSNPQTAEIAHRQLSAICHVIGVFNVQDSQQLHNIPFIVEVGLQKGEEVAQKGYTEVKKVLDVNGNEAGKAGQGQQQAQPSQPGGFAHQPQAPAQQQPQAWAAPSQQAAAPAPAWGQAQAPAQQAQPQTQQQPGAGWQQNSTAPSSTPPWGR